MYGLIEELGGNVITEDHDWGDRHFDTDVDLNAIPVKAIAARYMCRMVSPKKSFIDDHVAATVAHTKKTGAQGLLLYSIVEDETFAWDYPNQREALADIGVKTTAIGRQGYPLKATDELKAELKGFIDQLKEVK